MRGVSLPALVLLLAPACVTHSIDPVAGPLPHKPIAQGRVDRAEVPADPPPGLLATLERVRAAMQPLCEDRCGTVGLVFNPDIDGPMHARVRLLGHTLIEVQPPSAAALLRADPSVRAWAIAHEYGHHLDRAASFADATSEWERELRAEALAGCALRRMQLPVDPALDASREAEAGDPSRAVLADQFGADSSHPHWRHMRRAIAVGYDACGAGARTVAEVTASVANVVDVAMRLRSPLARTWRAAQDPEAPPESAPAVPRLLP